LKEERHLLGRCVVLKLGDQARKVGRRDDSDNRYIWGPLHSPSRSDLSTAHCTIALKL
jgi:hypothetical protein